MADNKIKALFLDRDGIVSKKLGIGEYVTSLDDFEFIPDIFKIIKVAHKKGYSIVIVTNQKCIARGLVSSKTVESINDYMVKEVYNNTNVKILRVYVCPHNDKHNCSCRKPKAGMIINAANRYNIDLKSSFMVGDSFRDIQAGNTAGCKTIWINDEKTEEKENIADYLIKSIKLFTEQVNEILV